MGIVNLHRWCILYTKRKQHRISQLAGVLYWISSCKRVTLSLMRFIPRIHTTILHILEWISPFLFFLEPKKRTLIGIRFMSSMKYIICVLESGYAAHLVFKNFVLADKRWLNSKQTPKSIRICTSPLPNSNIAVKHEEI